MKKNILIIVCSILVLVAAIAFFIYANSLNTETDTEIKNENQVEVEPEIEEEVSKTKDIENVDYNDFVIYKSDNTEVKFSDYKDKAAMLLFFNANSEDSMEVLDKVESMYKSYEEKIEFFMINTAEEVDEELAKKYTLEIYYDFSKEAAINYNITEMPSMIYIDKTNEVFNAKAGFTTTDALEANLDILSENI